MSDAISYSFSPAELVAAKAIAVAESTLRLPTELRELRWCTEVAPLFLKLLPAEIETIHLACGFANPVGWLILSQVLGLISGRDEDQPVPARLPHSLYTPRSNYGGWVRLYRSRSAALPKTEAVVGPMATTLLEKAVAGGTLQESVRGLLGIPPNVELNYAVIREALLRTDLFEAPWLVSVWTGPSGWVVLGAASRFRSGEVDPLRECVSDLVSRRYADQSAGLSPSGSLIPGSGPDMGLSAVLSGVEMALRLGYRLDIVWEPIAEPLDSWVDGVKGFAETPLMGVCIPGPVGHFLPAFQHDGVETRLEGIAESDYDLFQAITGIRPDRALAPVDFESLVLKGTPVFGRFATFAPNTGGVS